MKVRSLALAAASAIALSGVVTGTAEAASPPTPSLVATPGTVTVGQSVTFDLHLTSDPDGDLDHCLVDAWDSTPVVTVPAISGACANQTHTYTKPGTYTPAVDAYDATGAHAFNFGSVTVLPRFAGDPGTASIMMGINDPPATSNGTWQATEAALPSPGLGLHRLYTNGAWGLPSSTDMNTAIGKNQIPVVSWGFGSFGNPQSVPHSSVISQCNALKAYAPHPIWAVATGLHEPENDTPASGTARSDWTAGYRALGRDMITTCNSLGVTNVAWLGPAYMNCTFSGGCAGRVWSEWYLDCSANCATSTPTFYTGANRLLQMDTMDIYVPLVGSTTWTSPSTQLGNMTSAMTASGAPTDLPKSVLELGVKADTATPQDLTRGPTNMQNAYDTMLAQNGVGIIWWDTGGDSFRPGPTPASDPDGTDANTTGERLDKLASLVSDPRSVHL